MAMAFIPNMRHHELRVEKDGVRRDLVREMAMEYIHNNRQRLFGSMMITPWTRQRPLLHRGSFLLPRWPRL